MFKLDISKFIDTGSFFSSGNLSLKTIQDKCDGYFGSGTVEYFFECPGYKVSFIFNEVESYFTAEQFEIMNPDKITDDFLSDILSLENFRGLLQAHVLCIYCDDCGETVVFLKHGGNVHFNNNVLAKMTSKSEITRNFVVKHMTKIELYDAAP